MNGASLPAINAGDTAWLLGSAALVFVMNPGRQGRQLSLPRASSARGRTTSASR